ncbi:MAG: TraC family protein [Bdellovibrionales bacterium]|nr:TraC family protein [Bdellovibrionales bacterium]
MKKEIVKNIVEFFPYLEFLDEHRLFVLKDKSLGVIYRVNLLDHAPMLFEDIKEYQESFERLLDLPRNCVLQFFALQAAVTESEIEKLGTLSWSPESDTARFFYEKRLESLKDRARKSELLRREVYFSIQFVPDASKFSLSSLIPTKIKDDFLYEIDKHYFHADEFEKVLSRMEATARLKLERIDGEKLRQIVRKTVVPNEEMVPAPVVPVIPLSEQILFQDVLCDNEGLSGKIHTRTVSLLVPGEHCEGDGIGFLNLDFPSVVSMRITKPSKASVVKTLGIKEWCTKNSFSLRSKRQFEDIQETKKKLALDDFCLHLSWSVTVFGKTKEEAEVRANFVLGLAVDKFKCNGIIESDCGLDIFVNSLPLCFDRRGEWGSQRFIPLHKAEVACFLPVFGSFSGDKDVLQLFENREGGFFGMSPLSSQTSQHALFVSDTGGGKSFLINSLLNAVKLLPLEPVVFVFDFNTSQTMNAKLYHGEISRCHPNVAPSVNLFRGVYDEKKVSVLSNWMCEAIRLTSPSFVIESEHREALAQSIRLAYGKKLESQGTTFVEGELIATPLGGKITLSMDDIASELSYLPAKKGFEKYEVIVEALLVKLRSFYGDGMYANYIRPNEDEEESFDKKFYVVDFEGIKEDSILLSFSVASAFEQVRQVKMRPENENRQVFAVLDEIAELGRSCPLISDYFVSKAETSRKDAFWIWGATNRPTNFCEVPVCKALLGVVGHIYILPMSPKNIEHFANETKLLTLADVENIGSLRIEKGQWGEVCYISIDGKKKFIGRNRPSRFEYWQTPSNAEASRAAVKMLKKNNGDALKAIFDLVEVDQEEMRGVVNE